MKDLTTVSPSRFHAFQNLERIDTTDAFVGRLQIDEADQRERRQARELVAGVTRWQRRLDFLLSEFYNGDFEDMELRLQVILRLGLYEILYQDTPPHAAVDQYVELAKEVIRPGAGGLTNGILRAILRKKDALPQPRTGDTAEDLAIRHSHPTWMVRRWLDRFGDIDTAALLTWNNQRPMFGLRVNTAKTTVEDVTAWLDENEVAWTPSPYLKDVVRVQRLQPIIHGSLLDEGKVAIQDESASLIVRCLDPQPGETIFDLCSAPGGKTIYAAQRMHGEGRIIAFDIHEGRLGLVKEAAETHGFGDLIWRQPADARDLPGRDDLPTADRVLLDAPCSGLGVLSKRADLRWQRKESDLEELTQLQAELLDAAADLVRPGGVLVYSTCTIEPEENEAQVDRFLAEHEDFELESVEGLIADELVTSDGAFASLPHRDAIDGAYCARLRRVEG
ncbi:16S rRNA methyltransferase [Longibacter salinarum]|uniref:16S rRNA (cytosine(967)-C(5))-methyltransferase n=1 Tax=Longibacter salinarum TaxID=1850348 RepID=A0A2A8CZG3_9BACT|nr:16S rRNA (cytosine(967)-C(5))-methyltransferase RsmB [Longibacter salinarum]PEN14075.1 16S rRNA methyltransferase [Longibacter salinarum]